MDLISIPAIYINTLVTSLWMLVTRSSVGVLYDFVHPLFRLQFDVNLSLYAVNLYYGYPLLRDT
jgi:hypothetical protein